MGGRTVNTALRDWIVAEVDQHPEGISMSELRARFRKSDVDAVYDTFYFACRELSGMPVAPLRTPPEQRIHVVGYARRRDKDGRFYQGGRASPIYAPGPGENAPMPPLSKSAEYQRARRAQESLNEAQRRKKVETERRRALKRKPVIHEITAALFGMPIRRK